MSLSLSVLLAIFVGALLVSGVFSLLETALISQNRHRLRHLAERKAGARRVLDLLERPDRLLATVLLCNNLANVICATVAALITVKIFGESKTVLTISALAVTLLILIFSELTPKVLGVRHGEIISLASARPLSRLIKILSPLIYVVNFFVFALLQKQNKRRGEGVDAAELRSIVLGSRGLIAARHNAMLLNLIDLKDLTAEDVMASRREIEAVDLNAPDLARRLRAAGHETLPAYRGNLDEVAGFIRLSKALKVLCADPAAGADEIAKAAMTPPYFIPARTRAFRQLENFRAARRDCGLVVNESGEVRGLVTVGDFVDEILGEIAQPNFARRAADGAVIIAGGAQLRELRRAFHLNFADRARVKILNGLALEIAQAKTLNGLILEIVGDMPNGPLSLKIGDLKLEVTALKRNAIGEVKVLNPPKKTIRALAAGRRSAFAKVAKEIN